MGLSLFYFFNLTFNGACQQGPAGLRTTLCRGSVSTQPSWIGNDIEVALAKQKHTHTVVFESAGHGWEKIKYLFSKWTSFTILPAARNKRKSLERSGQLVFDPSDVYLLGSFLYYQLAKGNTFIGNLTKPSENTSSVKIAQAWARGEDKLLKGIKIKRNHQADVSGGSHSWTSVHASSLEVTCAHVRENPLRDSVNNGTVYFMMSTK